MPVKICLDAGHYGKYNRSPAVNTYYESVMTWKLHLLLKKHLEEYGFEVITTRADQGKDLALKKRGETAKGCDLFLSLHSNAVGNAANESVDRPVVIVPINGKGDELGEKLGKCIYSVMNTKQTYKVTSRKGSGNWDWYSVIYGAVSVGVVGIILEHSFHTNTASTKWLLDDNNLDKLAQAEADCLAEHYGLKKTNVSTNVKVGDIVYIAHGATYYSGKIIPPWVIAKRWIVKSISGDRAVIDKSIDGENSINSPVNVKYLTVYEADFKPYLVKITADVLNIRKGPGTNYAVTGTVTKGWVYTIVDESAGEGATKWGKLKSGAGWISLDYVE